jgi:hypothetical protein
MPSTDADHFQMPRSMPELPHIQHLDISLSAPFDRLNLARFDGRRRNRTPKPLQAFRCVDHRVAHPVAHSFRMAVGDVACGEARASERVRAGGAPQAS